MRDESRLLRSRQSSYGETVDRLEPPPPAGAGSLVVQTVRVTTYPTAAGVGYAVQETDPGGTEAEGAAGTFTPVSGIFFAFNVGSNVPPLGTKLLVTSIDGRWVFRF